VVFTYQEIPILALGLFMCGVFFASTAEFTHFQFFLVHFFVNAGMNAGIMPVVGVTLPFVSYGGSSLLSNFIFLGLLSNISVSHKRENVLEIK
jgi:cell division protein FtsW (lipid II flippase)